MSTYDNWKLASPYEDEPRGMNEDLINLDVIVDGVLGSVISAYFDGDEWLYEVEPVEGPNIELTEGQVEEAAI
jgi:hypothetical protein